MSDESSTQRAATATRTEEAIAHLRNDPNLGPLVEEHGEVTLEPADSLFERMIRSVVSQQVSTAAARSIRERLFDSVEITPEGILAAEEETLRDAGLSGQKVGYVRNIAEAFGENGYSVDYFDGMSNDDVVQELSSIKGVGTWTANMQLMFGLGRPDVFPVGDLGIRKGMKELFGEDIDRAEMTELAEPWRPYRSYAALYLWRSVD